MEERGRSPMSSVVPVVLFVYKRTDVLSRTLESLRRDNIPRLIVFSDGAKNDGDAAGVQNVRQLIFGIDWCEKEVFVRDCNLGLGKNILLGVTSVLERYESCIVFEDDLECVVGTYRYLCAALSQYRDNPKVYSVTAFTNRHIVPKGLGCSPYFDLRPECLAWGTWRRAWIGMMEETALEKMNAFAAMGGDPRGHGGDLPYMAKIELDRNIWAVRHAFHHMQHGGLCMKPPWSMVNHIGWSDAATNSRKKSWEDNGVLAECPPVPERWPAAEEHPLCAAIDRKMYPRPWVDVFPRAVPLIRRALKAVGIDI